MKSFKIVFIVTLCIIIFVLTIKLLKKDKIEIYDLDENNFVVLSNRAYYYNLLKYGIDYHIKLNEEEWSSYFALNFFLVNEDVGCLVFYNTIYLRNFVKEQVIRKILVEKVSFAKNINEQLDMIIFSGGNLYQYNFKTDKLTKLKHLTTLDPSNHSIYYPSRYIHPNKIAYSNNLWHKPLQISEYLRDNPGDNWMGMMRE